MAKFVENIGDEIALTCSGSIPLVRYNIHDRGRILYFEELFKETTSLGINLEAELKKYNTSVKEVFKLPFLAVYGRSDGVHFYAVNIYRENVMNALSNKSINNLVTGKFIMGTTEDKKVNQEFYIKVELKNGIVNNESNQKLITENLHKTLKTLNSEYNELSNFLSSKLNQEYRPKIILVKNKEEDFKKEYSIKQNYIANK